MNYSENANPNKTFLNQLPDVDEIQRKHIRLDYTPGVESGMSSNNNNMMEHGNSPSAQYEQYQQEQTQYSPITSLSSIQSLPVADKPVLSCMEVALHVQACPICSHYYNNNTTPYIVVIVTLIIIILFLIKNILKLS